jgi:hypothetical protein
VIVAADLGDLSPPSLGSSVSGLSFGS